VADLSERTVRRSHEWARQARATAARVNERVGEAGADLAETANEAGATVRDAASTAYGAAGEAYEAAAERSRQGADAIARGARTVRESAAASGQNVLGFLQEQPLVLAGIGLALGAVLGAALPSTAAEDRLMGEASEAAKRDAKAFADEQVDKGRAVAEQAWAAAKPEIDEQLRGDAAHPGGESREPDAQATLVPSDAAETASDGVRHDTGHRSE